ncbi:phospholipid-transporting ATPase DNF3 [Lecanosticta acicola]|uniref:Phospholipid-transporting ATPase n=1 Tax=Lecanosticta acicola TaxID=111012 RepID=A0AAI8YUT0_9PEZI|nr:phospholipid-transporting ATPase DNF3 [Lecanosticta acicola]
MTGVRAGGDGGSSAIKGECHDPPRRTNNRLQSDDDERPGCFSRHVKQPAQLLYQRCFVELVLRQKPLPPSKDGRNVPLRVSHPELLVDERKGHAYISNTIRSSRYTPWDFLPKQFLFQATRLHNFYFICIGVPQAIPGFSTTGNYTTILPLTFFILLTIVKEAYDDYRRHRMDEVENNQFARVLKVKDEAEESLVVKRPLIRAFSTLSRLSILPWSSKQADTEGCEEKEPDEDEQFAWKRVKWHNIKVGDVLKLRRDEPLPADIALLHASGENGVAFIETMALDGETSLKSKQAPPALLHSCRSVSDIRTCAAEFVLEDPNKDLYEFQGKVIVEGKTLPLTLNEVVFRGSVLRNTDSVVGIVINTGEECKIRMNASHKPSAKKPRLEKYANQVVLTLIFYVIILSVGVSMGYLLWHSNFETGAWYLNDAYVPFQQIIVGFLIMFNNVIPLALYVSLEIVKIGQMLMVQSDVDMYDEDSDTPTRCNTNTILEDLGQVSYVLSDKTGTLTENVMRFRGMSLGGVVWMHGEEPDLQVQDDASKPRISSDYRPKAAADKVDLDDAGFVVEEREIGASMQRVSKPRSSLALSRRSMSRPRLPETQRTTKELLDLIRRDAESVTARKAREFLLGLALCHTALPEAKDGQVDFQASSPDEVALVRAAQELGYLLIGRSSQKIELLVPAADGSQRKETYQILEVIEFSSKRKRMSIVVRCPDGRIWLICKGADSAIIPRLRQSDLAVRKSTEVRRSMDIGRHLQRKSEANEPRNSFGARPSLHARGRSSMDIRRSFGIGRATLEVPKRSYEARNSLHDDLAHVENADDATLFTRCFKHIDDFATEGLRTLLFAHKYLDAEQYNGWKKIYQEATTALTHRQDRIEAAGETIEQGFDLSGASAIEDKLQKGVPETIDRLRRANIKIWMLTGDKRETAINIAHSARICQPASLVYILDSTKGDVHGQMSEIMHEGGAHRVVVIDGHTLSLVSATPDLRHLFFTLLMADIDSVIVCRASPAQKSDIVKAIRARLPGLTLAIGDGANDIAMIQAAHVGIGISGKEGLQAARVADYSIAQFRYLQRLLLVHGRYQYVRTAKFILLTFWKEMFFYMMQALYQRYNGYTGTSLYESWSLTVLNTLFTSLCVIIPGIFEQDLRPATLLAIPELYAYGQRNQGLNLRMYIVWMVNATACGMVVWFIIWASYGYFNVMGDNGLFALGDLAFSLGIVWTNWKIFIIETHYKTLVVMLSFAITVAGWWAWNGFMSAIYMNNLSPYDVNGGFSDTFGAEWNWWLTFLVGFSVLATAELVYGATKRNLIASGAWPPWKYLPFKGVRHSESMAEDMDLELWQEMERDPAVREKLEMMARDEVGEEVGGGGEDCEK